MTIPEILSEAKSLSWDERKELAKLLIDTLETQPTNQWKTGEEIVALLEAIDPIEFVDPEITDPVEWVKAQRRKRVEKLKPYRDGEQ